MRIHSMVHGSEVNGPGIRTVVWVQGCLIGCPGCWNPDTHSVFTKARFISPEDLAGEIISNCAPGTTGVTVSGGEPMHQGLGLFSTLSYLRAARPDWSLGMFTGYSHTALNIGEYRLIDEPDLKASHPMVDMGFWRAMLWGDHLRQRLDWVKYGAYDAKLRNDIDPSRPDAHWVTSGNQWLQLVTTRHEYSDFKPLQVEITIEGGHHTITGFPIRGL